MKRNIEYCLFLNFIENNKLAKSFIYANVSNAVEMGPQKLNATMYFKPLKDPIRALLEFYLTALKLALP